MQRTKKLKVVLVILMLALGIISFNIKNVLAWRARAKIITQEGYEQKKKKLLEG